MAYKVFTAGEEALASDVNSLLMAQTVARFATAAARTSALTAPVLNQLSILDNRPGVVQYWTGSVWADVSPLVQGGVATGTLNASGDLAVTFPRAFGATPAVTATAAGDAYLVSLMILGPSASGFSARFTYQGGIHSGVHSMNWTAVGSYP